MAYVTRADAIRASRAKTASRRLAEADLRQPRQTPLNTLFDVFLSHSSEDAEVIAGVKAMLEREGLRVYVDWLEDPQADRSSVTPATAELLRTRMNHSGFLLYASSRASSTSRWMPWELGYFDGRRPGRVGILPIVSSAGAGFAGLEYLGLYPVVERIQFQDLRTRFASRTGPTTAESVASLATQ